MNSILRSFKRLFLVYLVTIAGVSALSFYVVSLAVEPSSQQKYGIIIDGNKIQFDNDRLPFDETIKKVTIQNIQSVDLGIFISAQSRTSDYDVLLVSKSAYESHQYSYSLLPLTSEKLDETIPAHSSDYLVTEEVIYGFKVTEHLQSFAEEDLQDDYYLSFFVNSVHAGPLKSDSLTNQSIRFANWLLQK